MTPRRLVLVAVLVLTATGCDETPNGTTIRNGWPGDHDNASPYAETTGPEAIGLDEDNLPACTHSRTAWTAGETVTGCQWTGPLTVNAPNVTLTGVAVITETGGGPIIHNRSTGLVITDSLIGPPLPLDGTGSGGQAMYCGAAVGYANYTLRNSEVYGCADGLKLGGTVVVEDSYIHGLPRTCGSSGCTHNDVAQKDDGTGLTAFTFRHNAAYGTACNSHAHFQMKNLTTARLTIEGNFFYGLNKVINSDGSTSGNSGSISGNTLAGGLDSGPFNPGAPGPGTVSLFTGTGLNGVDRFDNVFEDGTSVPVDGRLTGYQCETA